MEKEKRTVESWIKFSIKIQNVKPNRFKNEHKLNRNSKKVMKTKM